MSDPGDIPRAPLGSSTSGRPAAPSDGRPADAAGLSPGGPSGGPPDDPAGGPPDDPEGGPPPDDPAGGPPDDPDGGLAAEYVLRLLGPAEEAAAARREALEPAFAERVARWRRTFAEMDDAFVETPPPPGLQARVLARLFGPARPSFAARVWNSAGLWRGVALASVAGLVYLGAQAERAPELTDQPAQLISAIASVDSDVDLLALFEPQAAVLSLNRVSGGPREGRVLELWVIVGEDAPVSLGVLPDEDRIRVPLDRAVAERVGAEGALLAISDEPVGGSTTGAPTGAVLAAGEVLPI